MSSTHPIPLTGLDAQDPLGYLATLGCLLAATDQAQRRGLTTRPRVSFSLGGVLRPTLHAPLKDEAALLDWLMADLDEIAGRCEQPRDRFLTFSYKDDSGSDVHDLKPPPAVFREFASGLIDARDSAAERRTLDWAAAALTDVATDHSGSGKPFALHFTAGQQRFLKVALELLDGTSGKPPARPVDYQDLQAATFGPWTSDRQLKVFSWSPTQDRAYALRAVDPSGDKKLGNPGADWLALRGIGLLSSAPVADKIATSGVHGGWKSGVFSYPVWSAPLDADGVRSLLRHPSMRDVEQAGRASSSARRTLPRGVEVLSCRISRSDQGGYGAFSRPSRR